MRKEIISFSSLLPPPVGTQLDELFHQRNWQLQRWTPEDGKPGYQVYFGPGVQVDNHYEYGFPYLYEKAELLSFAHGFYVRQMGTQSGEVLLSPANLSYGDCVLEKSRL